LADARPVIAAGKPPKRIGGFAATPPHSQAKRLQEKIEIEQIVLTSLPELSLKILEPVRARGRISVADATALTAANRNTVKAHIYRLVLAGHLAQHGAGRLVCPEMTTDRFDPINGFLKTHRLAAAATERRRSPAVQA
jgi:hypothetical protein